MLESTLKLWTLASVLFSVSVIISYEFAPAHFRRWALGGSFFASIAAAAFIVRVV